MRTSGRFAQRTIDMEFLCDAALSSRQHAAPLAHEVIALHRTLILLLVLCLAGCTASVAPPAADADRQPGPVAWHDRSGCQLVDAYTGTCADY
jgi:hypothetical protein